MPREYQESYSDIERCVVHATNIVNYDAIYFEGGTSKHSITVVTPKGLGAGANGVDVAVEIECGPYTGNGVFPIQVAKVTAITTGSGGLATYGLRR